MVFYPYKHEKFHVFMLFYVIFSIASFSFRLYFYMPFLKTDALYLGV